MSQFQPGVRRGRRRHKMRARWSFWTSGDIPPVIRRQDWRAPPPPPPGPRGGEPEIEEIVGGTDFRAHG